MGPSPSMHPNSHFPPGPPHPDMQGAKPPEYMSNKDFMPPPKPQEFMHSKPQEPWASKQPEFMPPKQPEFMPPKQHEFLQSGAPPGMPGNSGPSHPQVNVVQRISGLIKSQLNTLQSILSYVDKKTNEEKMKRDRSRSRSRSNSRGR